MIVPIRYVFVAVILAYWPAAGVGLDIRIYLEGQLERKSRLTNCPDRLALFPEEKSQLSLGARINHFIDEWAQNAVLMEGYEFNLKDEKGKSDLIVVTTDGLLREGLIKLQRDYLSAVAPDTISPILHPRSGHLWVRIGRNTFDFYALLNWLRISYYGLRDNERIHLLLPLSPKQMGNLEEYVVNIISDPEGVLGPLQFNSLDEYNLSTWTHRVNPYGYRFQYRTVGKLDRNQLTGGETQNCITWLLTAPIGENGERLYELLQMREADLAAQTHSHMFPLTRYLMLNNGVRKNAPMVLFAQRPLSSVVSDLSNHPDFIESLVLTHDPFRK